MLNLLPEFAEYLAGRFPKPNTREAYLTGAKKWLDSGLEPVDFLNAINSSQTYNSRRRAIDLWRRFLAKHHPELPLPELDMPDEPRERESADIPPYADVATVRSVLLYMKENYYTVDYVAASIMYYAGLRIGEATALTLDDIKMRSIFVLRQKSGRSRHVPLRTELKNTLDWYITTIRAKVAPLNHNGLLITPLGRPFLAEDRFYDAVRDSLAANGIGMTKMAKVAHWFRHMCATHMLEAGANLKDIADFLGHQSINTTQVYLHISPQRLYHLTELMEGREQDAVEEARRGKLAVV